MSSFNNITKIKYTDNLSDLVTLDEYIFFQDDKAKKKYIVFKFINNVTQQLLGMEFEVCQYNVDGDLIEKSVVVYNKFLAGPEEEFVPKAKLRVGYRCATISVRLIKAAFDRFVWKEGEFEDNSFKFEHFYRDEKDAGNNGGEKNAKPRREREEKPAKGRKSKPKKAKKAKKSFVLRDATRKNIARFPIVFNVIIFILVIAFSVTGVLLVKLNGTKFTYGNYLLRVIQEDKTNEITQVAVYGYLGEELDVVIPDKLGNYTITRIDEGAFKNSDVKSVTVKCSVTISNRTFVNCENLERVTSQYDVFILDSAFINCPALRTVSVNNPERATPNSSYNPFIQCPNVKVVKS